MQVLVDQQLATIASHFEQLLGLQLTHGELCKIPMLKNQDYSARAFLRTLFETIAGKSLAILQQGFRKVTDISKARATRPAEADTAAAPDSVVSELLNPLNLASIEPMSVERPEALVPRSE